MNAHILDATVTGTREPRPRGRVTTAAASARAAIRSEAIPAQVFRFVVHFVEMAIAMEIGMMPLGLVLSRLGQADLSSRSPEAYSLVMNISMVLPMVAWMLIRRHGRRLTAEMAAAMIVPGAVLAAFSLAGVLPRTAALSAIGILMWAGMLGAMLFRWRAYVNHHHG